MTLVTRSAMRVSSRGLRAARANAAFFTTAAKAASALPQPRVQAGRVQAGKQGE
jgi:hypothetical protein